MGRSRETLRAGRRIVAGHLALLAVVACSTGQPSPVRERLLTTADQPSFPAWARQSQVLESWDPPANPPDSRVRRGPGQVEALWAVDLPAAAVDEIVVGLTAGEAPDRARSGWAHVTLRWSSSTEDPSRVTDSEKIARPMIQQRVRLDSAETVVRFDCPRHPLWRGLIDELRVEVESRAPVAIGTVQAVGATIDRERLGDLVGQAWKIEIGSDTRPAIVTLPGLPIDWQTVVPEQGHLTVELAHLFGSLVGVEYRVELRADEEWLTLVETRIEADETPSLKWTTLEADLTPWAGRTIDLRFATSPPTPEAQYGFPVWANPEVVGVRRARSGESSRLRNVVLISIDTLRADRLSLYGYERETSPNLSAWAADNGVTFSNAIAHAPWTLPTHTSMLTGLSTLEHGVNHARPLSTTLELLSERLRAAGYRTMAITGGGYVHPEFSFDQGFDRFLTWSAWDNDLGLSLSNDRELEFLLDHAEEWLERSTEEPFFLFFHTYDIHHGILPREPYFSQYSEVPVPDGFRLRRFWGPGHKKRARFVVLAANEEIALTEEQQDLPSDIYDSRITYLDSVLPRLFERLHRLGVHDDTLVVFTSDHGELLGEHGEYDHNYLYEENVRIPLVIAAPWTGTAGRTVDRQVRMADITPTILDLVDVDREALEQLEGRSLASLMAGKPDTTPRPALTYAARGNYGLALRYENRLKVVVDNSPWSPGRGESWYFDLGADPREQHPLPIDESTRGLADRLVERFVAMHPGLEARLENRSGEEVELLVTGWLASSVNTVKVTDLPGDFVSWEPRQLTVRLPAGTSFSLYFEETRPSGAFSLVVDPGRPDRASRTLEIPEAAVRDLNDTYRWVPGGGWQRDEADVDALVVRLVWKGPTVQGSEEPGQSEELEEQLRALGYL